MELFDAIGESLPAPRGDEPADLRRDIADELGDHLACALDHEQRQTDDEEAAKATVVSKFGSPQTIARRLWWDAMKEKIMTQRLTLAAAGMAMAACLGVALLAWITLERTQEVNLAIIAKLESLAAPRPAAAPQSLEWTEVRFRLVQEKEDGPPAEGFRVELTGNPINESQSITLNETSGSDGGVTFKPVRPGKYTYTVVSPWDYRTTGEFIALPRPQTERTITCPAAPPDEGAVKMELKWPDEVREVLKERLDVEANDLWVQCHFSWQPQAISLGDDNWYRKADSGHFVTVRPDGSLVTERLKFAVRRHGPGMAGRAGAAVPGATAAGGPGKAPPRAITFETATPIDLNEPEAKEKLTWREGEYILHSVSLLLPSADPENAEQVTLKRVHDVHNRGRDDWTFQLKSDRQNVWTIEMPMKYVNPQQTGPAGGGLLGRPRGGGLASPLGR